MTKLLALVVVLQAGAAQAGPLERRRADELLKQATIDHDSGKAAECGKAYLDLYNAAPGDPDAEEALFNAGVCFEVGRSLGAAIAAYEQLRTRAPRSKLVMQATSRLGVLYHRVGALAKAASMFEEYAAKFAAEKDAADALANAILVRGILADDAAQIADTQLYARLYGGKRKAEAAALVFALGEIYERRSPAEMIKHLREYVRTYGVAGGDELLLRAHARIGELVWRQACAAQGTADGLCIKLARDRVLPVARPPASQQQQGTRTRCGASSTTYTAIARAEPLAREARTAMTSAGRLFDRIQNPEPGTRAAYAMSLVYLADAELEAYVAVKFPTNLDFSPTKKQVREASTKRFTDYVAAKQKLGAAAKQRYAQVIALKEPTATVAAAARVAMVAQTFANELANAVIPADVRTNPYAEAKIEAFCDKLVEVAEPLEKLALDSYDLCIQKAGELGVTDEWARGCLRERAALAPTTFALTAELVPAAPFVLPTLVEEPVFAAPSLAKPVADAFAEYAALDPAKPIARADCERLAGKLVALAKQHKLADADYMAGLVYGRCDRAGEATLAYERALRVKPAHAAARSNLGELAWRAGDVATATKQWTAALASDAKLPGAYVGLASVGLRALPRTGADPKLVAEIRQHAQTAAGLAGARYEPRVQLAILGLEAPGTSDSLIRYYVAEAMRLDHRAVAVALVAAAVHARAHQRVALELYELAAASRAEPALLALGLHYVKLRRWDAARTHLELVKTKSYELAIGRGIVARGLSQVANAEARYAEAIALDPARPEAHFDLGVLWKDYVAARATDSASAKAAFRKAADSFRRVRTAEATVLAEDCDKAIATLPP